MGAQDTFWSVNIKFLRLRQKLSQEALAEKLGISRVKLNAIESGRTANPTVDDLINFTPELRAEAERIVSKYRLGPIFTPPSVSRAEGPIATLTMGAQAAAAGLPVVEARIPQRADNAAYEASFANALEKARERWPGIERIAFGDLFLADIRAWREALCARLGWMPLFPLFGSDTARLAREMMDGGLHAQLCCVDTTQLDARFAGRMFDEALLRELPDSVDPCGENGEFHTCVSAGPMFDKPIALEQGETVLRDGRFAYTDFSLPL